MPIDMDGSTEILERRRWAKDLPATGTERHRVVVTGSLVKLKGNADPYFLLTCEVVNLRARKGGPNWEVSGGADHALILEHWPELAPLADMHLGAPDGTPMHAAPNAIYWAGFSRWAWWLPLPLWRPRSSSSPTSARQLFTGFPCYR